MFPKPNNGWQLDRGMLTEQKTALLSAHMKDLMDSQAMKIDIATYYLHQKDERHINQYPKERTQLEIGSYILPFLRGDRPIRVGWNNENIYHLQNLVTQRVADYITSGN
jgi:hypothetical protein